MFTGMENENGNSNDENPSSNGNDPPSSEQNTNEIDGGAANAALSSLIKPCLISITSNQSVDSGHMSSVSDTMSGHEQGT